LAARRATSRLKPDTEEARRQRRAQAEHYLAALNAAVEPHKQLSGGTGFDGSLFLEFENGGALWQLSWRTPEPGEVAEQAIRAAYKGGTWPSGFQGQVYLPVDCH